MNNFKIGEKEHELKIDYKGVKYLNGLYEGSTFEMIGRAMMGDLETFPHIVFAALNHTGDNYTLAHIESAIDASIEAEQLDMSDIMRLSNAVVSQSHFYKSTVEKILAKDGGARATLEELLG